MKRYKITIVSVTFLFLLFAIAGCSSSDAGAKKKETIVFADPGGIVYVSIMMLPGLLLKRVMDTKRNNEMGPLQL